MGMFTGQEKAARTGRWLCEFPGGTMSQTRRHLSGRKRRTGRPEGRSRRLPVLLQKGCDQAGSQSVAGSAQ